MNTSSQKKNMSKYDKTTVCQDTDKIDLQIIDAFVALMNVC